MDAVAAAPFFDFPLGQTHTSTRAASRVTRMLNPWCEKMPSSIFCSASDPRASSSIPENRSIRSLTGSSISPGVSVTRIGDNITLNMPGNITFEVDKSDLRPDFIEVLHSVSLVLKEYKSTIIEVAGHTDSTGSESYNQMLSQQRAQAVTNVLIRNGVETVRIDTVGYGEAYPIASNSTPEGRQQNRRVELTLLPYTEG